jgi:conjugative transfer signal peptidase TraF
MRTLAIFGSLAAGLATLVAAFVVFNLRVDWTDSSGPPGIYREISAPPGPGDLVIACLPQADAQFGLERGYLRRGDCAGAEPILKMVGAVSGDQVDIEPGFVSVDGVRFPNSVTIQRDPSGRTIPHQGYGLRRVREGEVWLFGLNDSRSWDSRYFGPVPAQNIISVMRGLITW